MITPGALQTYIKLSEKITSIDDPSIQLNGILVEFLLELNKLGYQYQKQQQHSRSTQKLMLMQLLTSLNFGRTVTESSVLNGQLDTSVFSTSTSLQWLLR